MQKAFDLIVERLEESKERYDDVAFAEMNENGHTLDFEYANGKKDGELEAIEIVNQVAEEYKTDIEFAEKCVELAEKMNICDLVAENQRLSRKIMFLEAEKESNDGWIPCSSGQMPMEHDSIFTKYRGTDKWNDAMFEKISDEVNVTVADENGNGTTTHAHTVDGKWSCDLLKCNKTYKVIAWQPLPAPYQPKGE